LQNPKLTLQLFYGMSIDILPSNQGQFHTRHQIMSASNILPPVVPLESVKTESVPHGSFKINSTLLCATLVAALGGLLFGFDTIVISGCQTQLKALFHLDSFQQGFMTASAIIGTVIGALFAARPGDLYGRRDSLKVAGALYVICAVGCALSWGFWPLIIFRIIGGIAVGASSVLGPLYLAEISPARWRGRLVAFFQLNIVIGVLLAFVSNFGIGTLGFGETEWRWKLGVQALPAVAFFILLFFIPRSPRWLMMRGGEVEAAKVLHSLGTLDVPAQIAAIRESLHQEFRGKAERLFCRAHAKPIFLAITVAMFNQLDGINGLMYYLNPIFSMAGFTKVSGDMQSVVVGVANLLATMAGMVIIDRGGRKPLLIAGALGTGVALAGIAWVFNSTANHGMLLWLLVGYIICHGFGQGAVIWVYISEVFPNAVRAKGQTLGSSTHWFMAMIISWSFPIFAKNAGEPHAGAPFMFFAVMMLIQIFVVWWFYPETKRIPLEDMEQKIEKTRQ
jgi:MFS transporter, SP family, arabinose:H+ symporter